MKRFLGGLIWLTQIRYDLSFLVTVLATSIPMATQDARFLPHFFHLCSLAVRQMNSRDVTIWFRPFPKGSFVFPARQIISFSDAGFANLPSSGSTESHFIGIGVPLSRDGVINCAFHPILWGSRKIHRVVRSSLAAEVIALCSTIDLTYWLQSVLHELFFGKFLREQFDYSPPSPLLAPFSSDHWDSGQNSTEPEKIALSSTCSAFLCHHPVISVHFEDGSGFFNMESIRRSYDTFLQSDLSRDENIYLLILTDSANAFSSSHGGNPRSLDKHSRIHMCYVRDGLDRYNLSFAAAGFNVSDCGAKYKGAYHLVENIWIRNRCQIGFLSRDEMKKLHNCLRARAMDEDRFTKIR